MTKPYKKNEFDFLMLIFFYFLTDDSNSTSLHNTNSSDSMPASTGTSPTPSSTHTIGDKLAHSYHSSDTSGTENGFESGNSFRMYQTQAYKLGIQLH